MKSKRLEEIRNHVRQAHSVKNPIMGSHFSDECEDHAGQENTDEEEKDLAAIYDCLDQQIDFDVLNDGGRWQPEGEVIKEEDTPEEDAEKPPSVVESSGIVSKTKPSSSSSSSRPSRKRKRTRTNSAEKLVVKIQSKREKRKAIKKAETAATVVSEAEIKDEPLDDHD